MAGHGSARPRGLWRVVFYEHGGNHLAIDRTAPWTPNQQTAEQWLRFFQDLGYRVRLQCQEGSGASSSGFDMA